MQFALFFAILLFTIVPTKAQYSFDFMNNGRRVALVQAQVNLNNPSVTIHFLDNSSNTTETKSVYRRALFANNPSWTLLAQNISASTLSYTDNNVLLGQQWEYQVKRMHATGVAIGYTCASLKADKTDYKGRMLLVIDNSIAIALTNEIQTLKKDLTGDGWFVEPIFVNRVNGWDGGLATVSLKQQIVAIYNNAPNNDKPTHLFLLGHIPMPRSGRDAFPPDEHDENKGARGADCYYADMDGVYTDNQTFNPGNLVTPLAINLPNDNRFDQDFIPSKLEMAFGRVDFADLNQSFNGISEIELYRRYLNKLHAYKVVSSGYYMGNRCSFNLGYDNSNDGSYRSLIPISGTDSVVQRTNNTPHPLWVKNNGPFLVYMQNLTVPSFTEWNTYGMDAVVFSSDQSYYGFGDVAETGNYSLIRALLASDTKNLVNIWTTMGINIFHQPGVGETVGYACKQIMDHNNANNILEKPAQQYDTPDWWNRTHFAYHGDPTIRLFQVLPPSNLQQQSTTNNSLHLTWNKSKDFIVGYHVYSSNTEFGKYTRITNTILLDTFYTQNSFVPGTWYMIRAVKEQKTGSGIFLNPSQGIFIETSILTNIITPASAFSIQMYPNPVKEVIYIKNPNAHLLKKLLVFNAQGKMVLAKQRNTHILNVATLPKGNYHLQLFIGTQKITLPFVKD
jgi:hypothetical protein